MSTIRIISGGQSGVDRAALDVAIERALPYGGWCPRGGWAEDMPQPPGLLARYPLLQETPSADPAERTEWNVRDADATLIIVAESGLAASQGTALARALADKYRKPLHIADLGASDAVARAATWLKGLAEGKGAGVTLGIGGPRESEAPGIYARAEAFLRAVLELAHKSAP
jgi:hypothetical protein